MIASMKISIMRSAAANAGQPKPPKRRSTTQDKAKTLPDPALHERIAKRAYEIYERRVRQGALDDWLQAEREILEARAKRTAPKAGR